MRIILIGRSRAGKTTLCQALNDEEIRYNKTQTIEIVGGNMIDTPGEYLERTNYRGALTVSAADAQMIVLCQAANEKETMFPPGYASTFAKPCIGIVTKSDLAKEKEIKDAEMYLRAAGASEVFVTSSYTKSGIDAFMNYMEMSDKKMKRAK